MKRIHYILAISALVAAFVYGCSLARAAECMSSARSVWSAHPGSWATWRTVGGHKCYSIGKRKEVVHHQTVVQRLNTHDARPRFDIANRHQTGAVPLPRPIEREARWNYPEWVYVFGMWTEIMEGNQ